MRPRKLNAARCSTFSDHPLEGGRSGQYSTSNAKIVSPNPYQHEALTKTQYSTDYLNALQALVTVHWSLAITIKRSIKAHLTRRDHINAPPSVDMITEEKDRQAHMRAPLEHESIVGGTLRLLRSMLILAAPAMKVQWAHVYPITLNCPEMKRESREELDGLCKLSHCDTLRHEPCRNA